MRKILCGLLAIILFISGIPLSANADEIKAGKFHCITNALTSEAMFDCMSVGDVAYMRADDAALAAGYAYSLWEGVPTFHNYEREVIPDTYITDDEGDVWVPISETLAQMDALVTVSGGCVLVRSKLRSADEVYECAEKIFEGSINRWDITSVDGFCGNVGVSFSTIYNVFTEWKFYDAWTGKYSEDMYEEAFALIMAKDNKEEDNVLSALVGMDEIMKKFSALTRYKVDVKESADIMKQFAYGNLTDGETLVALYDDYTDPLGQFTKLKGLNLGDQLGIYQYLASITNASAFYVDMVEQTLFSDYIRDPYGWGQEPMIDAAEGLISYYASDSFEDILREGVVKELESVLYGGANGFLETVLEKTHATLAVERIIIDLVTEFLTGTPMSEITNDLEVNYCLAQIQTTAHNLYQMYRNKNRPLEAKYAALLYLRCGMVWSNLYEEQVKEADFKSYREGISKLMTGLMEISDYDITLTNVENPSICYDDLQTQTAIDLLPIDISYLVGGSWSTIKNLSGYDCIWVIDFCEDGTVSLYDGIVNSEMSEYYSGTFKLTDPEEEDGDYTIELDITGGFWMGYEEGFEQKHYELILHVVAVEDGSGAKKLQIGYVGYRAGGCPAYFGHDLPAFSFEAYDSGQ